MSRLVWWTGRLPPGVRRFLKSLPGTEWLRVLLAGKPTLPPPSSGTLRPVVYLPTWLRWDVMRQRPQYLLAAFAQAGHPVYFVDTAERAPRSVRGVSIVPGLRHVPGRSVILYLHFAPLQRAFKHFADAVIVYDILDDLSIYDEDEAGLPEERKVRYHHPELMRRADLVIASDRRLGARHRQERSDLVVVENGVDPELFAAPTLRPTDLPSTGPIIGYHGMISHWFDFDLLEAVAGLRPAWNFVLVGPVDPRWVVRLSRLRSLPNVFHLGERASDRIPDYVQAFDVGAIWFKVNDLTTGVTPLKMFEYLAAGVPCVSTPLPAAVAEPIVATAADAEDFSVRLDEVLAMTDAGAKARRHTEAMRYSWSRRLAPVLDLLETKDLRRVP